MDDVKSIFQEEEAKNVAIHNLIEKTIENTESSRKKSATSIVDNNREKNLIKRISIFDCVQSGVITKNIKQTSEFDQHKEEPTQSILPDLDMINKLEISENKYCTTCKITSLNRIEQIEHYKCDLHLFNIKQKLKEKAIVTIDEFEQLTDISSISGSDSEEDLLNYSSSSEVESQSKVSKNPKLAFELNDGNFLIVQRCILQSKKELLENEQLITKIQGICVNDCWAVILVAAGHFAASIFKGNESIAHKTFHRYVVRAKRGTVQSQHDKSSHAKSAGANIRRANEAAFKDEIRILLGCTWKSELENCKCIFIRCALYNRSVLISNNKNQSVSTSNCNASTSYAPFHKDDLRIRNIPFMTFRPTFKEVKRAHMILSQIEIFKSSYLQAINTSKKFDVACNNKPETAKTKNIVPSKVTKKKTSTKEKKHNPVENLCSSSSDQSDDVELVVETSKTVNEIENEETNESSEFIRHLHKTELELFNNIYTACLTNDLNKLKELLSTSDLLDNTKTTRLINKLLNKRMNEDKGFTLLHMASELGHADCVWLLLLNGSDPSVEDLTKMSSVPYLLGANKATKDMFRRFMHDFPDRYNYESSKIPGPISEEQLNSKAEKEKERKKLQKIKAKQRLNEQKTTKYKDEQEAEERKRFLSLTDDQKRALVVDRNFLNILPLEVKNTKLTKQQQERLLIAGKREKFYQSKSLLSNITEIASSSSLSSLSSSFSPTNEKTEDFIIKIINRCWMCGVDISSSTPFEYFDYKFCSTKCLKDHREKNKKPENSI